MGLTWWAPHSETRERCGRAGPAGRDALLGSSPATVDHTARVRRDWKRERGDASGIRSDHGAPLAGEGVHCDRIAVNMPNVYREILIWKR